MKIVSKISVILCIVTLIIINILHIFFFNYLMPFLFVYTLWLYPICIVFLVLIAIGKRKKAFKTLLILMLLSPVMDIILGTAYEEAKFNVRKDDMETLAQEIIEENMIEAANSPMGIITSIDLPEDKSKYSLYGDVHLLYTGQGNYAVAFTKSSGILSAVYYMYFLNTPTEEDFENDFFKYDSVTNKISDHWYKHMS